MKSAIFGIAFIASATAVMSLFGPERTTCNQALMESYDIDGQPLPVSDSNVFCTALSENCCSYSAQLQIYKKWIIKNERNRIDDLYHKFEKAYGLIFDQFLVYEKQAELLYKATKDIPGSNCFQYSNVILRYKISEMREQVLSQAKRAYKFLLQSRQGFYCSLCDPRDHQFYNQTSRTIQTSYIFCSALVDNSLNFFLYRYKFFVKVARLYSQFLMNCDLSGRFFPDLVVSNDIKFFRRDSIVSQLETCRKGYDKPGAIEACEGFCSRFNPVHYDQLFEGEIDKLYALEGFMKRRLNVLRRRRQRELTEEGLKSQRLLEEKVREEVQFNELNSFNKEFKTVLAMHHPYRFKYDTYIKYHTSFDEPLFEPGVEKIYDLVDFHSTVKAKGLDFYSQGEAVIDRQAAMRAFELLNPEKKGDFDFDDFLKKD